MTEPFYVGCKAFALEINTRGLRANYKHRCAGITVIKNVKDVKSRLYCSRSKKAKTQWNSVTNVMR